ncbi:hypothetical protein K1719_030862 [Acacia pycnantha]|nr:hypothetical protein K1719_030862 [Acacia pycnantha]
MSNKAIMKGKLPILAKSRKRLEKRGKQPQQVLQTDLCFSEAYYNNKKKKKKIDNPRFRTFMMIRMEKSKSSSHAFDDKIIVVAKKKQKPTLSESEMEAARQLIELSNGDSSSGHRSLMAGDFNDVVEDNNSSNSFSVQGRPQGEEEQQQQKSKLDDVDVSSNVETMNDGESLGEIRTSTRRRRKNKRYRFILDLYRVTEPVISR